MATILSLLQTVTDEVAGLARPSSVVASTDRLVQRLLALTHRVGKELRQGYDFPQLLKEGSFTLVSGQASYALPEDFERWCYNTQWDGSSHLELLGPLTPEEYEWKLRGISSTTPRRLFKVSGVSNNQVTIVPTPVAADAGLILYTQYISTNWILPVVWTTTTSFSANTYCSYNGNIYKTSAGGTTGATPPTHTTTTPTSDGGVTWTYQSGTYDKFLADTDTCALNDYLVVLGVKWRWLEQNGLDYQRAQAEYEDAIGKQVVSYTGARDLSLVGSGAGVGISIQSIPDTGYGN